MKVMMEKMKKMKMKKPGKGQKAETASCPNRLSVPRKGRGQGSSETAAFRDILFSSSLPPLLYTTLGDLSPHDSSLYSLFNLSIMSLFTAARCAQFPSSSRRAFSVYHRLRSASTSTPDASSIAASFLSRFQSLGPQSRTQILDANQLQLLSLTLNRPSLFPASPPLSNTSPTVSVPQNTPVPPGYHLVYFTPAFLENELGPDGTDVSYNPSAPFTRRMWAGGEVHWRRGADGNPNPLRVGQKVRETTKVLSAEPKVVRKTGEEMIVVGVEKEFRNEYGVALLDRR